MSEEEKLRARYLIASMEFNTAEANMELHRYDEWQCNHREWYESCTKELEELFSTKGVNS